MQGNAQQGVMEIPAFQCANKVLDCTQKQVPTSTSNLLEGVHKAPPQECKL
jgi:hypothetical protein